MRSHNAPLGSLFSRAGNGGKSFVLAGQPARCGRKPRPAAGRTETWLKIGAAALFLTVAAGGKSFAEDRALRLYNLHTHERATIVFKRNGVYDRAGLQALNAFLRDWRAEQAHPAWIRTCST